MGRGIVAPRCSFDSLASKIPSQNRRREQTSQQDERPIDILPRDLDPTSISFPDGIESFPCLPPQREGETSQEHRDLARKDHRAARGGCIEILAGGLDGRGYWTVGGNPGRRQRTSQHGIERVSPHSCIGLFVPSRRERVPGGTTGRQEERDLGGAIARVQEGFHRLEGVEGSCDVGLGADRIETYAERIVQIANLDACTGLKRVDVSENRIDSLKGFEHNPRMKWLNASGNRIRSLDGLERMEELQVLNCSHNHLQGEVKIRGMGSLGALILNNNDIVSIAGLSSLKNLNTLVLSNNRIQELGTSLKHLVGLKKLSASHNSIREIGKSLKKCTNIQELRLGHNKITSLPKELVHNGRLRVLDLGHNLIADFAKVDALKELKELRNLNLSGNPLACKPGYREHMLGALPWLEILDGHALQPRKGKGKKKRVLEDPIEEGSAAQRFQGDGKNAKIRFDKKDEDVPPPGMETTSDPIDQQGSFLDSFADVGNVQGPERRGKPMYGLTTAKVDARQTGVVKRIDAKRGSEGVGILGKEAAELLLRQAESNGWTDGAKTGWEDDLPLLETSEPTTIQVRPSVSHTITSPHPVASGLPKASLSKRWASGGRRKARPMSTSIA